MGRITKLLLALLFFASALEGQTQHKFVKVGSRFTYQQNAGPSTSPEKVIQADVNEDTTLLRIYFTLNSYISIYRSDVVKINGTTVSGNLIAIRDQLLTDIFSISGILNFASISSLPLLTTRQDSGLVAVVVAGTARKMYNIDVAKSVAGGGSATTSASDLTSGTLADARLSANVITTTGSNTISADRVPDGTTNKAYTATEKTKLAGIATGATANSSDATLLNSAATAAASASKAATTITEDATHRFATDAEKTTWNAKQDALVSGASIKTFAGSSILASGDVAIYQPVTVSTYSAALSAATGTAQKLITVTADNKKYYYEGVSGQLVDHGALTAVPSQTVPSFGVTNGGTVGTATFDSLTGLLGSSGSYGAALSGSQLNYIVMRASAQFYAIGKQADGTVLAILVNSSNIGNMFKINVDGSSGGFSTSGFPTSAIPATATRIKIEWSVGGDLTISYKTLESDAAYTTWGTRTAAQLASSGYNVTSKQMGAVGGIGHVYYVVEWQTTAGVTTSVGDRRELGTMNDLFARVYPFYNKSVVLFGNSITAEYPGGGLVGAYTSRIKAKLKAGIVLQQGYSGYTLGTGAGASGTLAQLAYAQGIARSSPDVVIIEAGTNDYGFNVPLGDPDSVGNATINVITTTVGGLGYIISNVRAIAPGAIIVVCTPSPRTGQETPNSTQVKKLSDYVTAIKKTCQYYGVPVCDLFNLMNVSFSVSASTSLYQQDGLHPNDKGYDRMTDIQVKFINNLKW